MTGQDTQTLDLITLLCDDQNKIKLRAADATRAETRVRWFKLGSLSQTGPSRYQKCKSHSGGKQQMYMFGKHEAQGTKYCQLCSVFSCAREVICIMKIL